MLAKGDLYPYTFSWMQTITFGDAEPRAQCARALGNIADNSSHNATVITGVCMCVHVYLFFVCLRLCLWVCGARALVDMADTCIYTSKVCVRVDVNVQACVLVCERECMSVHACVCVGEYLHAFMSACISA